MFPKREIGDLEETLERPLFSRATVSHETWIDTRKGQARATRCGAPSPRAARPFPRGEFRKDFDQGLETLPLEQAQRWVCCSRAKLCDLATLPKSPNRSARERLESRPGQRGVAHDRDLSSELAVVFRVVFDESLDPR